MNVIKRDGKVVNYDKKKVIRSLKNSGVSKETINIVLSKINEKKIKSISTNNLYKIIYKLVRRYENEYSASIYSLKRAIINLGPEGHVFEDFIGKIFTFLGYDILVRQVYESNCITHELDVVGKKEDFFIECKFHNKGGVNTPSKDVLYSYSRFIDLKDANKKKGYNFKEVWLVTNTKISNDGIAFGEYWKMKLLSWKYPKNNSLSDIIDSNKLYPISMLPNIDENIFNILYKNKILLINELCNKPDKEIEDMGIDISIIDNIRKDCDLIKKASEKIKKDR